MVIFPSEDEALNWEEGESGGNLDTCVLGSEVTHLGSQ